MSISSSLNAGVSGLSANSTRLSAISDNIANSSTYGYKRVETDFTSQVLAQSRAKGTYAAGGVTATTTRLINEDGSLVTTSNSMDLAVSGRGFLPVTAASDLNDGIVDNLLLTTTGSFTTDDEGVLKTTSGLVLLGWPANADGEIVTGARDAVSGLQPVVINSNQTAGNPTTTVTLGVNLPATSTEAGSTGTPQTLPVEYWGNLGTSETLQMTFTPTVAASGLSNEWTMEIRDSATIDDPSTPNDESLIGSYVLVFDDSRGSGGTLQSVTVNSGGTYDPATGTISLTVAGGPLELNVGKLGDANGLTQLSSDFSPTLITKDGSPVGTLTSVEVDENGYVRATYDSGFTRVIYQVPLVDVANPNGLKSVDAQTYRVSPTSGSFYLWTAGDGPTGTIEGYSREISTVDIATELTNLIQTQRAYSSNAKVIQTVDEMLQETTNIKR